MKIILLFIVSVSICSCSVSGEIIKKYQYEKQDFDYDQYQRDRYQCEHDSYMEASQIATTGRHGLIPLGMAVNRRISRFEDCMRVKGYYRLNNSFKEKIP